MIIEGGLLVCRPVIPQHNIILNTGPCSQAVGLQLMGPINGLIPYTLYSARMSAENAQKLMGFNMEVLILGVIL